MELFFQGNFFLVGGGPESRVQCTVQSRFRIFPKDDMTSRQGDTTEQGNTTRRQICSGIFKLILMILIQEHPTEYDVQKTLKLHKILIKME